MKSLREISRSVVARISAMLEPEFLLSRKAIRAYAIGFAIYAVLVLFPTMFRLQIDPHENTCLPYHVTIRVIGHPAATDMAFGDLISFTAPPKLTPVFKDKDILTKRVFGVPGDTVIISAEGVRNGEHLHSGILPWAAELLKKKPEDFYGVVKVGPGELFLMGDSEDAYDSRYYGTIEEGYFCGKTYALW